MRKIKLYERDSLPIVDEKNLSNGEKKISEQEADGLQKLLHRKHGVLSREYKKIRFGSFCGVLRTREIAIELLPKIYKGSQSLEDIRGLFVNMLRIVGKLRLNKVGEADLGKQSFYLLDVFIQDFCERVKTALRGGVIARYEERVENLRTIRGRLQLTEHLRQNAFDQSRLLCRFDEYTIDNSFNRVLKGVLLFLLGRSLSQKTKATVTALLYRFDEVADKPLQIADFAKLAFDRTNSHWQEVFEQAEWLCKELYPDVRLGDVQGSAILFDMEHLFEKVLGVRIRQGCSKVFGRDVRVKLQDAKYYLAGRHFNLRPDITVWHKGEIKMILDAKWKQPDANEPNAGVSSPDAYQMNAYASRYGCERLALVYPASEKYPAGFIKDFQFRTSDAPTLDIVAVDVRNLAFERGMPPELANIISDFQLVPASSSG